MWYQGLFHKRPCYIHVRIRDLCQCGHYPAQNSSTLKGHLVRIREKPALVWQRRLSFRFDCLFQFFRFQDSEISTITRKHVNASFHLRRKWMCHSHSWPYHHKNSSLYTSVSRWSKINMDVRICLITTVSMMFAWIFQKVVKCPEDLFTFSSTLMWWTWQKLFQKRSDTISTQR